MRIVTSPVTDDAIAWAVNGGSKLLLIAPCCHHDIQKQIDAAPEPWGAITKFGLMKERLGDLLTDSLRAQLLRLVGYRVEVIEFVGGEHTPRNLMIRAARPSSTNAFLQSTKREISAPYSFARPGTESISGSSYWPRSAV